MCIRDSIGTVQETETIVHKIMVPPGKGGIVKSIENGDFNVTHTVCTLEDGTEMQMMQKWPVRTCLLYTSPSPRDRQKSRMPSSACKKTF